MKRPSIIFCTDYKSDSIDESLHYYTDFTEPGDEISFCSDEPLDHLYTDFDKAYISVPEYRIFLPVPHSQLFHLSQYYRSALAWNHGTRSDNPHPSSYISAVITLPPFYSRSSIVCFIDLLNDVRFDDIFLQHFIEMIFISGYLAIDDSWLATHLPNLKNLVHGYEYLKYVFIHALYHHGYPELAFRFCDDKHQRDLLAIEDDSLTFVRSCCFDYYIALSNQQLQM